MKQYKKLKLMQRAHVLQINKGPKMLKFCNNYKRGGFMRNTEGT